MNGEAVSPAEITDSERSTDRKKEYVYSKSNYSMIQKK